MRAGAPWQGQRSLRHHLGHGRSLPGVSTTAEAPATEQTTDSLQLFLDGIAKTKLLTAADEVALSKRVERGDLAAKDHMVQANLRLVVSIAKRYRNQGLEFMELIRGGWTGRVRAVKRFDYGKGFKFPTTPPGGSGRPSPARS